MDFLMVATKRLKSGVTEIYPKFIIKSSKDLMIRARDFYAIWLEETGLWSTDEQNAVHYVDMELELYAKEHESEFPFGYSIRYMWDSESRVIDDWHRYCQKQMRDNFTPLDENLIFTNTPTNKKDFASKRLPYALEPGPIDAYQRLFSVLYSEGEKHKLEWAVGAILTGDAKTLQKFMVLYGSGGTGKSTFLNLVQQLFDGYWTVFDSKALGSANNQFALESFRSNPLVAIQHDGDLSKIEDNTRINSLVSHEMMSINEKFKGSYGGHFKCFMILGTNKPVRITDAKSGLIRRLIDVSPSGNKVSQKEYDTLTKRLKFELGGIACHCIEVYNSSKNEYDSYIPINMLGASNDFYNFMLDSYFTFKRDNSTTLQMAYDIYKRYCDDASVPYPLSRRAFKEELKNYFEEYHERYRAPDDTRIRNYYAGFRLDQFDGTEEDTKIQGEVVDVPEWLQLKVQPSIFDNCCKDRPAQYANEEGTPTMSWDRNKLTLSKIKTSALHYVQPELHHIVIDFDGKDSGGNKSLAVNIDAAKKFPPTYAEASKSGGGLHLHYLYSGDATKLSRVYDSSTEIKVFTGAASLRRMLSICNDVPIATISSGLPIKEEVKKMIKDEKIKSEAALRTLITRNLCKEIHEHTSPSINFIHQILEDAYASDLKYDVSDMRAAISSFASKSSNGASACMRKVGTMKFASATEEPNMSFDELMSAGFEDDDSDIFFFDCEVFPNLLLIKYKQRGAGNPIRTLINPEPSELSGFFNMKQIGFNNRDYDNHIIYARMMGASLYEVYQLSKRIIDKKQSRETNGKFGQAYNLSYSDIYDFLAAVNKMSLKKWEIKLKIHHQELGLDWDSPVPDHLIPMVSEYCDWDVLATEAVFEANQGDWMARKALAKIAGMSVNDTTNSLSTRIIFGRERNPNGKSGAVFNWRDLGEPVHYSQYEEMCQKYERTDFRVFDEFGEPTFEAYVPGKELPPGYSIMPFFPGYKFAMGKSTYMGEEIGEGGEVYAEPGMHGMVGLKDVVSMHPTSALEEWILGPYTKRFRDIVFGRIAIKHRDFKALETLLGGILRDFITDDPVLLDALSLALKTVINSVYGLTCARFANAFRDDRNMDNIVAKRGALFMCNLRRRVQEFGFTVAHVKTDSIKIPDATPEILEFVDKYGKEYGYEFEHEATYDRICLVNDAVYVAKYATAEACEKRYGYVPKDNQKHPDEWTSTGKQFSVPYVFKTLFSGEALEFDDLCETFSVQSALYLDMDETLAAVPFDKDAKYGDDGIPENHDYHFIGKTGRFTPISLGSGAGRLLRKADEKYHYASGAKGYRWLESEKVQSLSMEGNIDYRYFENLLEKAKKNLISNATIEGGLEWFLSDEPYVSPCFLDGRPVYEEEIPFY